MKCYTINFSLTTTICCVLSQPEEFVVHLLKVLTCGAVVGTHTKFILCVIMCIYICLHVCRLWGGNISRVSDQNGVSLLYIMLEIYHSGREPSIY